MQGDSDYERELELRPFREEIRKLTLLWYKEKQKRIEAEKKIVKLEAEMDQMEGYNV